MKIKIEVCEHFLTPHTFAHILPFVLIRSSKKMFTSKKWICFQMQMNLRLLLRFIQRAQNMRQQLSKQMTLQKQLFDLRIVFVRNFHTLQSQRCVSWSPLLSFKHNNLIRTHFVNIFSKKWTIFFLPVRQRRRASRFTTRMPFWTLPCRLIDTLLVCWLAGRLATQCRTAKWFFFGETFF